MWSVRLLSPPPPQVWSVYRVDLERWMVGILQPVFDEMQKPDIVRRVRINRFYLGEEPLALRSVERRTSRRANDIQ